MGVDKAEASSRSWRPPRAVHSAESQQPPTLSSSASPEGSEGSRALYALLTCDTGWLRATVADGGKTNYLKWKWTSGALSNRYVMVVGPPEQLDHLLVTLLRKVQEAEVGKGRTSADRYYQGND